MTFNKRSKLFLLIASLVLLTSQACNKPSELIDKIQQEQQAIIHYADACDKANQQFDAFFSAWTNAASSIDNIDEFKDTVTRDVLLKLDRYVNTLKAIPIDSEELKAIHTPVVTQYEALAKAFNEFLDNFDEKTFLDAYKKVQTTYSETQETMKHYEQSLRTYYATNQLTLKTEE